mgnify:CR=1 FL=1|tara:strand:+ start:2097 stop:3251 length:1155 start_codon:yes stop_codon:yes gene_type:complete
MAKVYLDLKTVSSIPNAYKCSADEIMAYSGLNIGNFAFRHALHSLLEDIGEYTPLAWQQLNELIAKEPIEQVIVSCANWLCATEQYEKSNGVRASIIEKLDCPVISFGLGAQASSKDSELNLGPNTVRLAKVLAEKCTLLSVRDEFTLNVLEKIGVQNAVVTGCPSNFINLDPDLGKKIVGKSQRLILKDPSWNELKIQFNEYSGGHVHSGGVLKRILRLLEISPSNYVIQSPVLLPFLLGENENIPNDYLNHGQEVKNIRLLLKAKLLHFSSIDSWLDFSRTCDFATGMRIHGNMIPLQSGVPSVVIGHDSRTAGLASYMGIPSLSPDKFMSISNRRPSFILEDVVEKMAVYDERRSTLAKNMLDYIEKNKLTQNKHLNKLIH